MPPLLQGARVVTPEAVVLDVQTAGFGSRALARTIDALIQGAALIAVFTITGLVLSSSGGGLGTVGIVIELVVITIVVFGYPIVWESLWRGRTPGKAVFGLRVVTRQGAPIRFRHALVRGLLGLGEVMALPLIGVVSLLVSTNDQRLGDMAAGTIVIRERAAASMSAPVAFYPPPGWESVVESMDVSGMSSGDYETVRSFLIRAHEMAPVPRSNLAARLAGPLVNRLHQPVPPGAGPELWLACVACAYQRRHGAPAPPYGPGQWGPPPPDPPGSWGPPPPTIAPATATAGAPPGPDAGAATPFPPESAFPAPGNGGFAPPD